MLLLITQTLNTSTPKPRNPKPLNPEPRTLNYPNLCLGLWIPARLPHKLNPHLCARPQKCRLGFRVYGPSTSPRPTQAQDRTSATLNSEPLTVGKKSINGCHGTFGYGERTCDDMRKDAVLKGSGYSASRIMSKVTSGNYTEIS